ncbi:MAG: zinc-ribbon domain-containing protein [Armatimonadota bacterium]|nr:zinc-ribbon domain-containing protein [Armatimonadota bacterium]
MDDFLRKAREAIGDLAGSAGREAEILKLQTKMGALENDLDRAYEEAGKRARELLTMRQVHDEELAVLIERAREIEAQMMEIRAQIKDLRADEQSDEAQTQPTCPECGATLPAEASFCPECGVRVS